MAGKLNPYPRVWMDGRSVRVHRLLAAKTVGRALGPSEVVHHRNGNKDDLSLENLVVLPSQRHHMALEHYERREARGVQHLFDLETWLDALDEPSE